MSTRRIKLDIEYDGTDFVGWQVQARGRTVQGELSAALDSFLQQNIVPVGAGRTDAGVHARGQIAHFDTDSEHDPGCMKRALNAILPEDIAIKEVREVPDDFHARYSALSKRYCYSISMAKSPLQRRQAWTLRRPKLDIASMQDASRLLCGVHGFEAFCNHDPPPDSFLCDIADCQWLTAGDELVLEIEANRFLRHMVRIIVGTLVEVGRGKMNAASISKLLTAPDGEDEEIAQRSEAGPTAPACGLCLLYVKYELD